MKQMRRRRHVFRGSRRRITGSVLPRNVSLRIVINPVPRNLSDTQQAADALPEVTQDAGDPNVTTHKEPLETSMPNSTSDSPEDVQGPDLKSSDAGDRSQSDYDFINGTGEHRRTSGGTQQELYHPAFQDNQNHQLHFGGPVHVQSQVHESVWQRQHNYQQAPTNTNNHHYQPTHGTQQQPPKDPFTSTVTPGMPIHIHQQPDVLLNHQLNTSRSIPTTQGPSTEVNRTRRRNRGRQPDVRTSSDQLQNRPCEADQIDNNTNLDHILPEALRERENGQDNPEQNTHKSRNHASLFTN